MPSSRRRSIYVLALLAVVVLGLASRRYPGLFPTTLGKYPGDALWAAMVFLGWGLLLPRALTSRVASLALATSIVVEVTQLYHSPWLDHIRATTLGHLVLGSAFAWTDILAYGVGILAAAAIERGLSSAPTAATETNDERAPG